ncbi:uncharacterized protein LOC144070733 [Stigmatopora argus]
MCKVHTLRAFLNQRLNVAVEEIIEVFERTVTDYEDQLCRAKEENERLRHLLDSLSVSQATLQQTDFSQDDVSPEEQEWNANVERQEAEPPHIKEEEQEDRIADLPVTVVAVKNEADRRPSEEKLRTPPPSGSSGKQPNEENPPGGSGTESYFAPLSDTDDVTANSADSGDEERAKGDKRWKCCLCDKIFGVKMNLKRHMIIHTGEKPFACSVCGKRFTQKAHLTSHFRTHTGEKPFACLLCGKRFSRSECLITHTRTHTGEKPFRCNLCDQRFSYKYKIKKHKCAGERDGAV